MSYDHSAGEADDSRPSIRVVNRAMLALMITTCDPR